MGASIEAAWFHADDGSELACYEAGNRQGPPVVLCGGLGGGFEIWRPLIERLADRFRLLGWDYRGLYRSPRPAGPEDCSIARHVQDLRALLRHCEVRAPVVVGWSMGVQVALELYRETPDLALGLVAIHGAAGRPFTTAFDSSLSERLAPGVLGALRSVGNGFSGIGPRLARAPFVARSFVWMGRRLGVMAPRLDLDRFREIGEAWTRLDLGVYADIFEELGRHDASDLLDRVRTPALLVAGERDRFTPAHLFERMAERMPDAGLEIIGGATHFGLIEYPDAISESVERFLAERLGLTREVPGAPAQRTGSDSARESSRR
jgi:pimeloyl-ACP methyl ester carboxylesterase